ncbi:MAG: hypothetical protein OCU18_01505 [Candidatus Syntrophoarchaeum sp.]|nr:hypothetical protein [Candidatus Syntrophoarchaeum sp.]
MNSSQALPRSISLYYHSSGIDHTLCVIVPIVIIVIMGVIEAIKTACICNLASILQSIVSPETTHRIARVSRSPGITLCKIIRPLLLLAFIRGDIMESLWDLRTPTLRLKSKIKKKKGIKNP